jgi:crotonobetainyl-CoA:carnitine CoA-transferase CaiB-like acyl-CoA transferase
MVTNPEMRGGIVADGVPEEGARQTRLPLEGVRVIDHTDGGGTETVARILADLGADAIRVEPPEGARSRRGGPQHAGTGLYDLVHNANKRSVALDLGTAAGRADFVRLVASADILVTSFRPGELPAGLDAEDLAGRFPSLVVVSVTGYGRTGPYRDWAATEATQLALGGVLCRSGLPGREPLLPPGDLGTESAAAQAAWGALVAYHHRLDSGLGDLVDCSGYEAVVQTVDACFGMGGSATGGVPAFGGPRGRPDARHLYPVFRCADGWVRICVLSARQWQGMFRWLGEPEEFADPKYGSIVERFRNAGLIYPAIGRLLAGLTRAQAMAAGDEHGVPTAGLASPAEVFDNEQFRSRGVFTDVVLADGTVARIPNGLLELDGERAGVRTRAPGIGAHTDEVLSSLPPVALATAGTGTLSRPLSGLRVLDLGVIVVGAETGRLFADLGADVIKVESRDFPDGSRQTLDGSVMSAGVAYGHRSKRSLGLNLRSAQGKALFLELVRRSDVVLSNFKPGTMESLGLGAAELAAVNARIVVAESSAFGSSGPWSRRMGYGPLVRASVGLSELWRFPGESEEDRESFSDASTIYPDHIAARIGATAVLAKLIDRRRTGRGGAVTIAQTEVILGQFGTQFALESVRPGALAAGTTRPGVLDAVYPCAGDDEWCVVSLRDDDDWSRLAAVIGAVAGDPRFTDQHLRHRHRADLDTLVSAWTIGRGARETMTTLQEAGVPAAMMQRIPEMLDDPQLAVRRFLGTMTHPLIDSELPCENGPAVFRHVAEPEPTPAPCPGEHSRKVLREILRLDAAEIDLLVADGVVEESGSQPAGRH